MMKEVAPRVPPMHVAMISCTRKHTYLLGPSLLSLSHALPSGTLFKLFTDKYGVLAIAPCTSLLNHSSLNLEVLPIEALGAHLLDYNASAGARPRMQQSKFTCASAKLMLQGGAHSIGRRARADRKYEYRIDRMQLYSEVSHPPVCIPCEQLPRYDMQSTCWHWMLIQ